MSLNSVRVAVCGDKFYFYYDDTQTIYCATLNGESLSLIQNDYVLDIVSNGKNVYFVSKKSEGGLIRKTVDCDTNGIWQINTADNTIKRISDECAFDSILATKNYVYCYKVNYLLPRGMDTMFSVGYSIEQIEIPGS